MQPSHTKYETDLLIEPLIVLDLLESGELARGLATEIREIGIPYRPSVWRGGLLSPAERARYSLTARRLEAAGMIERHAAMGGRCTHLRPTAAGVAAALDLAGEGGPDREAIERALAACEWTDAADTAGA